MRPPAASTASSGCGEMTRSRVARESGMVIEGPNCLGFVNHADRVALTFAAVEPRTPAGPGIAAVSQSGAMAAVVQAGDDAASAMSVLLRKITGFSGLVHDNMYRSMGWRFLTIGRSLERAMMMASALAHFCEPSAPDGSLDLVVEFGDSEMSYRQRYAVATGRRLAQLE